LEEADKLSLYRAISEGGYEASVLATYSINFPFYERVVLRRLQAAGCRLNILLVDGRQCAGQLASTDSAPQFSGADYLLLPISRAAAFHPKFMMLLGKKGGRLILGSHNVTVAGFGLNREIGSAFTCAADTPSAAVAQDVWTFVRAWTADFAPRIQDVISAAERSAPWLASGGTAVEPSAVLWCGPNDPPLWDRFKDLLGGSVTVSRVTVISPYFDRKLSFVREIAKEFRPKELIVAVHPKFSELPANAMALAPQVKFLDVSGLGEGWLEKYLHAKLYRFELSNGRAVVVIGSANASAAAWLERGEKRNAELIAVHQDADQIWKRLGLSKIGSAPTVSKEGWLEIGNRHRSDDERELHTKVFVAVANQQGFVVDAAFASGVRANDITVFVGDAKVGAIDSIRSGADGTLCVYADSQTRIETTRLEVAPRSGPRRVALVHHVTDLLDKAAGNLRQQFRRALSGLEGDPEQITELMKVVEKAIFDQPLTLNAAHSSKPKQKNQDDPDHADDDLETLAISAKDTAKARRKRRLSAATDLAVIIDALIYRLGQGLPGRVEADVPTSVKTSEEALRDEEAEPPEFDGRVLAKACRSKVNRLFKRMIDQCELAARDGKDITNRIVQLAAVLGVVKHLRARQDTFAWLPKRERLVDVDHAWDFFKDISKFLYAPAFRLAAKALAERDATEFAELAAVRGLLAWLAFDCELDARTALNDRHDDPDVVQENLAGIAYLLPVITECAEDDAAQEILADIVAEQKGKTEEVTLYHLQWGRTLARAFSRHQRETGAIGLGDLVEPVKMLASWPLVVVDPQHNKTGIVDLDTGEKKYFGAGFVARLQRLAPASH
jgi:hypothetical protein